MATNPVSLAACKAALHRGFAKTAPDVLLDRNAMSYRALWSDWLFVPNSIWLPHHIARLRARYDVAL